jgi:hypothetical protein
MYPWALAATPLPIQFRKVSHGRQANQEFAKGFPGVFQATISVPEMFVPPLPVATDTGIAFPYGSVTGFWPRNEIEYALSLGCSIERIHSAATFQRERLIFRPWVEKLFDARIKFGKKSREGAWLKLVLNSLTGKLGSRSERHAIKIWPNMEELRICECENPCECDCGCFQPLDLKGRVWESVVSLRKVEPCAHAEWAAYLTGAARVKLHRQLIAGGSDDAVYCDTDSCWSEKERLGDSGKNLGEWEPTGRYRDFESLGPKTYHAVLAGEEITAAKGIPKPVWANLKAGKPNPYSGVRGLRRAKKGERFFEWVKGTRVVTPNTGRRLPAPGGLTRPPRMAP